MRTVSTVRTISLLVIVMLLATLLAACSGAATPTKAPEPTKPPEPTAVPVELMKVSAADCAYGGAFKSIEALDANTVKFTMCAPDVAFPSKVAFSAFAIHSSDYLEKTGGAGDLLDKPVGTGPYMLDKWQKGDSVIMKANPNYWGDKAQSPTLVFRWQKEAAARLLELQSGTTDGIDNPGPDDFKVIEGDSALKLYPREALNVFYLGFSNLVKPFDNEMVRQAVAWALTASASWTTSIRWDRLSPATSRRAPSLVAAMARSGTSSMPPRPRRCWPMPASPTASRPSCPSAMSCAAICRSRRSWPRTSRRS